MLLSLLLSLGAHALIPDNVASTTPPLYDIRDFFQNPKRSGFRISDQGRMIGFMEPVKIDGHPARQNIFVQELKRQ